MVGELRRAVRAATVAVVLALLVTGCTADAEESTGRSTLTPDATATPASASSGPPTPDVPAPPARPTDMATPSAEGAAAAATYFMSLHPYVFATGDLAEWDAMSADGCGYCSNTRASVEDQLARGVRGEGSEIAVQSASGVELVAGDSYAADLDVAQGPSFEVSPDGVRRPDGDGGTFRLHISLWWRDGWLIRAVDAARV